MDANCSLYIRSLAPVIREALVDTPVVCLPGPRQSGAEDLQRLVDAGLEYYGKPLLSKNEADFGQV